jgi:hypothetical protein
MVKTSTVVTISPQIYRAASDWPVGQFDSRWPKTYSPIPKAIFLVEPDGFRLAKQSASDNAYMVQDQAFDEARAHQQFRTLHTALRSHGIPAISFPGDPQTPDAVFPNNVFATIPGRLIIGHMRHDIRQREANRNDIAQFFTNVMDYECVDLRAQEGIAELTGSMVIDRARGVGFIGLSERCDELGALAMARAFSLDSALIFSLAPTEYHTNVVLSSLLGRGIVIASGGFADTTVFDAICTSYGDSSVVVSAEQKSNFAANCIALSHNTIWMSERAAHSLTNLELTQLERLGFAVVSVALDEIEKAGGSLRCMIGEIY